jgi:hypothetical protein
MAQPSAPLRPIASIDGQQLYKAYCEQCHGPEGRGDGVRAPSLRKPPADLTTIAARHGGEFPREYVIQYIMGTARPGGRAAINPATGRMAFMTPEGPADMPVWGAIFRKFWPEDPPRLRFESLAKHLQKMQQK